MVSPTSCREWSGTGIWRLYFSTRIRQSNPLRDCESNWRSTSCSYTGNFSRIR
ncbi:hypothetical protein FOPG_18682 [Fusarium oxysporum f. sp. conglutinans race 2 54008]|uniref:Uncharacterized protein n=1 Tax=Fusarium oxysporum f. sp. conglutinans race 2 54008 TaxID=1089457 RepID=X0GP42_FUSOX|nr:hypothetical protein FOPG_18682 [Fusarium oxysporum f. sp. conglutinans race 2 54008]